MKIKNKMKGLLCAAVLSVFTILPIQALETKQTTASISITPDHVTVSATRISILHDILFDATSTNDIVYTYKIPTALVSETATDPISISKLPEVDPNSVNITLNGKRFDPEFDTQWDGTSYYEVSFKLKTGGAVGEVNLESAIQTPSYKANTKMNLPIQYFEDGQLKKEMPVNIQISGTKPTVINAQVSNPKFAANADQYAQAKETSKEGINSNYNLNLKMAIGEISMFSPENNREIISLNSPAMNVNGAKGVYLKTTLPEGVSVYKNAIPEYTDTASGIMIVEQKLDITDPKLPNLGAPYSVSQNYREVGGNFGDPLNSGEVRVSQGNDGRWHVEVKALDLSNDVKLFVEYYQQIDYIPTTAKTYPEFVNLSEVTWDGMGADFYGSMTWQTFKSDKNSAFKADMEVDRSSIFQNDELTYTIHIETVQTGLKYVLQNNMMSDLPIIEDSITVNDNAIRAELRDGLLIVEGDNVVANKNYDITFRVNTDTLGDLTRVEDSFFLVGSDDVLLRGNTLQTNVMGKVVENYVDEEGNTMLPTIETVGKAGTSFTTHNEKVEGYHLVRVDYGTYRNPKQQYHANDQEITYIYRQNKTDVPTDNGNNGNVNKPSSGVSTGDIFDVALLRYSLMISAGTLVALLMRKKIKSSRENS